MYKRIGIGLLAIILASMICLPATDAKDYRLLMSGIDMTLQAHHIDGTVVHNPIGYGILVYFDMSDKTLDEISAFLSHVESVLVTSEFVTLNKYDEIAFAIRIDNDHIIYSDNSHQPRTYIRSEWDEAGGGLVQWDKTPSEIKAEKEAARAESIKKAQDDRKKTEEFKQSFIPKDVELHLNSSVLYYSHARDSRIHGLGRRYEQIIGNKDNVVYGLIRNEVSEAPNPKYVFNSTTMDTDMVRDPAISLEQDMADSYSSGKYELIRFQGVSILVSTEAHSELIGYPVVPDKYMSVIEVLYMENATTIATVEVIPEHLHEVLNMFVRTNTTDPAFIG